MRYESGSVKQKRPLPLERNGHKRFTSVENSINSYLGNSYFLSIAHTNIATAQTAVVKLHKSAKVIYLNSNHPFIISQNTLLKLLPLGNSFLVAVHQIRLKPKVTT